MEVPKIKLPNTKLFINNEWVDPVVPKTFKAISPITEQVICEISEGDAADVDKAVKVARDCFDNVWTNYTGEERGRLLYKLADLIDEEKEYIAQLESLDNGKPIKDSFGYDVFSSSQTLRYYAGWADKVQGKQIPLGEGFTSYTRHEPIGVVGFITPWNFPLMILAWKFGPAIAAGCTIVAKPSEETSLTALYFAELVKKAGFPPGVFNLICGYGVTVGNAISGHMGIDKVSFTGSTRTGKTIMASAAQSNLKKVTLELGGKSPNIIFEDADLEFAAIGAKAAMYFNMGQSCIAGSRLFVQESIYDKFLEIFTAKVKELKLGNPYDKSTEQGSLASKIHFDRVMSYINKGKEEGATIHLGGGRYGDKGYFVEPTIFTNVKDSMTICKEEIFGPVICILPFKNVDEVLKRANDTEYGLAAGVFTKDINLALQVGNKLKAGSVWINQYNMVNIQAPFGGYKQSGIGKDLGEYAIIDYCAIKTVAVSHRTFQAHTHPK
ncbi:hypothetical protein CYY_008655 [Polysphondylium violaceum]|uniref:Aldehyde dehydrogenase domain-containing protein n=1 Tax=Polysphondylium violaceum TaxID=133409 RepID=A0A8J4PQ28_9MYCE|nr:hypothetical protein CYY_008655 [Polysphondylium violaceum]